MGYFLDQWVVVMGLMLVSGALGCILTYLSMNRRKQRETPSRRFLKQRDTEENIGKRFAKFLRNFVSVGGFWVEDYRVTGGPYEVHMGEKDKNSFLTIRISLSDPEDSPIYIMWRWPDEKWDCGMDEASIRDSIVRLQRILMIRYYPYLMD